MELAVHEDFYLKDENLHADVNKSMTTAYAICSDFFQLDVLSPERVKEIYRKEVLTICTSGKEMGMWQLHALASIFKRSLVSVYPKIEGDWLNEYGDGGLKRLDVYREIKPRVLVEAVCDGPNPTIMWTKMGSRGRTWRPNHFVACLPPSTSQSHSVSSGKRKADLREFFWKRTKTN